MTVDSVFVQGSWSSLQTTALRLGSLRSSTMPCLPKSACTISMEVRSSLFFLNNLGQVYNCPTLNDFYYVCLHIVFPFCFRQCWSWYCLRQVLQSVLPQYHWPRFVSVKQTHLLLFLTVSEQLFNNLMLSGDSDIISTTPGAQWAKRSELCLSLDEMLYGRFLFVFSLWVVLAYRLYLIWLLCKAYLWFCLMRLS
jgi:hypothetical protein